MTKNSWVLVCLAVAPLALAQDSAPLKLTLHDAVALALRQNPRVILANLNVAQSTEDSRIARAGLLPQVGAGIGESVQRNNVDTLFGQPFPGIPQHIGPFWVEQEGIHFSAPLDLTLWRRYKAAQTAITAARAGELTAREESVLLVVSQYLGCQRAAADVEAAEAREKLAQALYDQAADLQKNGVGTGIDTLRANVQLQNEKQRAIVAHTELETGLYGLGRLLSVDPKRKVELADQVQFFSTPDVLADQTLEHAYATRPELRQIAAQMAEAQIGLLAAREARLPKIEMSGSWAEQGLTPNAVIPVYQYQASLEVPLFTGGRIDAERAKAEIALRQLKQQEQAARDSVALEVKTSIAQLAAARNEVDVANLGVLLARQEVDQARDRFQAGVANNIEVVNAQNELARANDNQIAALYRYNQARADLAHAAGQMETTYGK
jgi:outer membrane protein TolC